MCAVLQLVSAPLNPRPFADHFRRINHCVSTVTEETLVQARKIEL